MRAVLAEIGRDVTVDTLMASNALMAPFHDTAPYAGVRVERDLSYGEHERHRLDLFLPDAPAGEARPVVVFLHGGSFVGGDKHREGSPFHDNVGLWAARRGMVGVTANHRLAPAHPWPAGPEDVAGIVRWIRAHANEWGGDARRLHLMGASSGAVHVATYLAHERFHAVPGGGVASASMIGGAYALTRFDAQRMAPYFGDDPALIAAVDPGPALAASDLPILYAVAEWDPLDAQDQFAWIARESLERRGTLPPLVWVRDANHFTITAHLGAPFDALGPHVEHLIAHAEPSA
ncbi:alpha/beta hydrolase [Microbacterium album]|uniref:alpha/beta hydrolase n=1 Tax=Microbacterium album TaxID=2053191 RepID=UPI001662F5ED|nr:alpha/beta hydrolase [Microbacterium album]